MHGTQSPSSISRLLARLCIVAWHTQVYHEVERALAGLLPPPPAPKTPTHNQGNLAQLRQRRNKLLKTEIGHGLSADGQQMPLAPDQMAEVAATAAAMDKAIAAEGLRDDIAAAKKAVGLAQHAPVQVAHTFSYSRVPVTYFRIGASMTASMTGTCTLVDLQPPDMTSSNLQYL